MTLLNFTCTPKNLVFTFLIFLSFSIQLSGQPPLDCDASSTSINYNGSYQDFLVPDADGLLNISFTVKGGDGGGAIVNECQSNGGRGSLSNATFDVGSGINQIPIGSTIRFIVGGKGMTGASAPSIEYGGGGGGSAVLYKKPGSGTWEILVASGGGGGAYQRRNSSGCANSADGQGGNDLSDGINGTGGAGPGVGGTSGNGGGWNGLAAGGGGAYTAGGSLTCFGDGTDVITGEGAAGMTEGGAGGGDIGCTGNPWRYGGYGFGGGASAYGAGGGGGGFSGGGAGGRHGAGGGGGSIISTSASTASISGGGIVNNSENGYISYSCTINLAPEAKCKDITIYLDDNGFGSVDVYDIDDGSNDPDGTIEDMSIDMPGSVSCADVGTHLVTLTVVDDSGMESTCTSIVEIMDLIEPSVNCADITIQLDNNGNAVISANDVIIDSSDNCGIESVVLSENSFNCSDVGANLVIITVTDVNGNVTICASQVTVEDNDPPVANCKDITIQLDPAGNVSIVAADVNNGSSEECAILSEEIDISDFNCSNVGINTVTLTVIDVNNNESSCTATVIVEDNIAPDANCQDITIQLDASGNASITTGDINNNSNDACGIASMSLSDTDFTCSDEGLNTVILTVTDNNGNVSNCNATVTVEDNVAPTALCRDITIQLDASGNASIVAADIDNGSNDACGIASLSASPTSFDCTEIGSNTVTLTVTDNNGNVDNCTATVTVEDNIDPQAICQDITVQLDANGNATITAADINGGASDACGDVDLSIDNASFNCSSVGPNTVTLTVTDGDNNESSCQASVTVEDNVPPTALCKDITIQLDASGNASIVAADIDNGSNDACGVANLSATPLSFDCNDEGPNSVTLTVTDNNGNVAQCNAIVTVEDNVPPVASCQDITIQLNANGNASIVAADIDNGSNDACGIANLEVNPTNFNCSDIGSSNQVTLTVTDNNGNQSQCNATVTVEDNVAPDANCQDITIQLDASGNASITTGDINNNSNDACGIASMSLSDTDFTCSDEGLNTVILTVTDNNGNVSNCNATVTVEDNVAPTALCRDITIQLDASGNASIVAADIDNGSNDACGIASLSASPTSFDCTEIGGNTVTLTVTDNNGNVDNCTATVTVEDNIDPQASCQDITVQLDANGNVTITAADINGGASDACGDVVLSIDNANFNCSSVGPNTVTLTVTDGDNNESSCQATVTVEDNVPPTALCKDITIQLDASGNASIVAADIDNGSNDACGVANLSATPLSFDCNDEGPNSVTLTVTDNNGNVAQCNAIVTVEDNVPPVASCQDITIQLNANGNASIVAADIDNGSNDACGIANLEVNPTNFNCSDIGSSNQVTLTVTDNNGNQSQCNATVTVEDNVAPDANCQDITIQLDASGNSSITTGDINNNSNDACGIASMSLSDTDFTCSDEGLNTVILTVTDNNGNVSNCNATVTVEDNVAPTALCRDITIQLDASGNASIVAADIDNGSNDACGIASLSASPTSFDCTEIGGNTVTLTVTDNNGNVDNCTATVTVEDNIDPQASCQDITVQLDANGNVTITAADINGGASDACGDVVLSIDNANFNCSSVGPNTVTLTVTDGDNNESSCQATVTVEDNVPPTALCKDITIQLDASGNASIVAADIDNGSNDACGIASISATPLSFDCNDEGTNTVTLTVTDNNGNVDQCNSMVTVEDNVAPTAICQDITIQLDASGNASIVAADIDNGSNDACGIASLSVTPSNFDCSNVGSNSVVLTVTDNNGNQSQCNATVTVEDNVAPDANCQDITIQLDAQGNASITTGDINDNSSDACGIASMSLNDTDFTCSDEGSNTVTLTVTDVNGNMSNCNATVTVEDNVAPVALCKDITIQLDASGNASIVAADIDNGSNDACGIASLSASPTSFDCTEIGGNTVTLTVTDNNGNVDNCTATVTVEDNIDPQASCQDITVQLDANGNVTITAADINGGASDACGDVVLSIDNANFNCSSVGPNTVTLTVTDGDNNESSCQATVTVEDNVPPTALCKDITIQLDASGNASIVAADIDNGSNDACGIASISATPLSFDCNDEGTNTVTLTVTDNNGNVDQCNSMVTVEDNVAPTAICQDITIQLDASGNASIVAADIDNGSNDACGIASLSVTPSNFDCSNVGSNSVVLTVTDNNGNQSQCNATVTVEDNVAPDANCQDITIQLDAQGNASITTGDINDNSSDACGIASMSLNDTDFTCSDEGSNTVTLTVTDVNGNMSNCNATVTVEDNVAPVALCKDITIQLDASGNASIVAADIDNGSNDACGIASLSATPTSFDCTEIGGNTVTLTVTDNNGNVDNCNATVTVEDNVAPSAICQDITIQLDAAGNASITASQIDNGSSDVCGAVTLSASPTSFDCTDIGSNTVTLTVTDQNENQNTCNASVTVEDNVAPTAICQDITVQLDAAGNASITASQIDNGSSDVCSSVTLSASSTTFDCTDVGPQTVTLTVVDQDGNQNTCDATVTVEDNVLPTAICQDITIQLDAAGNASIVASQIDNGSSDVCGAVTLSASPTSFDCTNIGSNTVTLTVTDQNGNQNTCDAIVTVEDNVIPAAICQDITVQLDAAGNASITASQIDNGSSDVCTSVTISATPLSFNCSNLGQNTVTLTVTDQNGNQNTCDAIVTIEDNVSPTALCQDITIQLDDMGNVSIIASQVDNGSSDVCGNVSLAVSPSTFTCGEVGANSVVLTVEDDSGNVNTCEASVTVQDITPPQALCQDITIQLDMDGNAAITANQIDNGSNDACGVFTIAVDPSTFTCDDTGPNLVTLTVTDVNNNENTCTATVTVQDINEPMAICRDITVCLDSIDRGAGWEYLAGIRHDDIDDGSFATCDNGSLTYTTDMTVFGCDDFGQLIEVMLTVTDSEGNQSMCLANVEVGGDDDDCDNVPNGCDICPNGDDNVDLAGVIYNDPADSSDVTVVDEPNGIPDCYEFRPVDVDNDGNADFVPPIGHPYRCGNNGTKFLICHFINNPTTNCVSLSAFNTHVITNPSHANDVAGPCTTCTTPTVCVPTVPNYFEPVPPPSVAPPSNPEYSQSKSKLWVYPNPSSDKITLVIPDHIIGETYVQLIGQDGKVRYDKFVGDIDFEHSHKVRIVDLDKYNTGIYFVRLINTSEILTNKVVIVK